MTAVGRFSTRPLYLQVKDTLVQRIVASAWKPGAAIPNEIDLSRLPIRTVTDQYLAQLEAMNFQDLEEAGAFMVLAATLIYLK